MKNFIFIIIIIITVYSLTPKEHSGRICGVLLDGHASCLASLIYRSPSNLFYSYLFIYLPVSLFVFAF
jgi:hypothetical protein